MITTKQPVARFLLMVVSLGIAAPQARALSDLSFTFGQDGYASGATISGSFLGADLDGNGLLVHFPTDGRPLPIAHLELTSLSIHFSGNSLSPAFDLTLDDLYEFVYEIGSSGLGDGPAFDPTLNQNLIEGIGAFSDDHFYASGLGPNNMIGGRLGGPVDFNDLENLAAHALDSTDHLLQVAPVPEPAGVALMIAGSLVAGVLSRGRRAPPCSSE